MTLEVGKLYRSIYKKRITLTHFQQKIKSETAVHEGDVLLYLGHDKDSGWIVWLGPDGRVGGWVEGCLVANDPFFYLEKVS